MTTLQRSLVFTFVLRAAIVLALVLLATMAGCTDGAGSAGPIALCGPAPASAGYSVAYARTTIGVVATLNRDDFEGLISERNAMRAWAECVASTEDVR